MIVYLVTALNISNKLVKKGTYFNFKLHIVKLQKFPLKCSEGCLFTPSSPENSHSAPPPGVPLHCIYSREKYCIIHLLQIVFPLRQ